MSSLALSCPALHHNIPQLPVQVSYCVEHLSSVIDSDSCRIGLIHSETSGNLDIYRSVDLWIVWDGFPSAFASAHTGSSEISQGIFLLGAMRIVVTLPEKLLPAFILNVPSVGANIRVPGESRRIWFSELRSLARCSSAHSSTNLSTSRASIHMNAGSPEKAVRSIFTIFESRSLGAPMTFRSPIGLADP